MDHGPPNHPNAESKAKNRAEGRTEVRPDLIPNTAVRRLSLYLRQLESFKRKDRRTISSRQLGESLSLTDAQVRKDLAYFGQFGHPGIGYRVDDLIARSKAYPRDGQSVGCAARWGGKSRPRAQRVQRIQ